MDSFDFKGAYHVQSKRNQIYSELQGNWYPSLTGCLTSGNINNFLRQHIYWKGDSIVNLRPALVRRRTGAFKLDPESEYFKNFFTPAAGSPEMKTHVLDVQKLVAHWNERKNHYELLVGSDNFAKIESTISDPSVAAINKYLCHDGGHLFGWNVDSKYASGYFRILNKTTWPLIFVEEFRADLHSFGIALALLPLKLACAVFLFHILRRFGLVTYGIEHNCGGPGASPYLLFCLLYDLGFLRIKHIGDDLRLDFANLELEGIAEIMRICELHAFQNFTILEMKTSSAVDIALNSAIYYEQRIKDEKAGIFAKLLAAKSNVSAQTVSMKSKNKPLEIYKNKKFATMGKEL